jgi:hypothetical protein
VTTQKLALWALLAWFATGCDEGGSEQTAPLGGSGPTTVGGTGPTAPAGGNPATTAGAGGIGATLTCTLAQSCEPGGSDDPGTPVTTTLSSTDQQEAATLAQQLSGVSSITAQQFATRYATSLGTASPGYDAASVVGMAALQASTLALNEAELGELKARGFTISERLKFPSYVYGLETFYALDLPLFVSADSILYAIHQSYDSLLRDLELTALFPTLKRMLGSMRAGFERARGAGIPEQALVDADLYLTVAASLLAGTQQPTVAGASAEEVACMLRGIQGLQGCVQHKVFGVSRVFDFSQFTLRGHYTQNVDLGRYFQTMMWLGRVDLRLIETQPDATQRFNRRQLEAALALRELFDASSRVDWTTIDRTVGAFVGEHDSMTPPQLDALLADLGVTSISQLATVPDQTIAQAIIGGRYGTQRISSHIMVNATQDPTVTLPLSSIFLIFGQRYVVDSHVFSNVVYDRVKPIDVPPRMLPDPLDAAFAAFGNDQAGQLLGPEVATYGYAPNLTRMRVLVDAHPEQYWDDNLYTHWVGALRSLSTAAEARDTASVGLPSVAGTEAWGRRLLNSQLASWSELRHDTLLYAKQSYTTGMTLCDYPDAYVEPYPAFWAKILAFAEHGKALVAELGLPTTGTLAAGGAGAYFDRLGKAATILKEMAERQRTGAPHDAAHIAFINQAVRTLRGGGCGGGADASDATGWYADLFYDIADKVAYDPNIADVHTQPTDEQGSPVGHVLHVGTGMPRLMVVTAENCSGPRAYVGLVSAYFERVTDDFKRLTDEEWSTELLGQTPADVPWMSDLVVR